MMRRSRSAGAVAKGGASRGARSPRPATPSTRAPRDTPPFAGSPGGRGAPDGLQRVYAPWRMAWIRSADEPSGCLFCRVRRSRNDRASLVLVRRPHALLMLNRYPYTPGHLMVATARHAASFAALGSEEGAGLFELIALAERVLAAEYRPHGINYGANAGRAAGAGFPGHLHVHLVPRWGGDTNFMTAVAGARVLPETLPRTWGRLRRALRALARG